MQKTYTPDCLSHRTVKNKGQERKYIMRDHHPAIISRERWEQVQDLLSSGRKRQKKRHKSAPPLAWSQVKRGSLKGFVIIDPHWKKRDLSVIQAKIKK